MRARSALRKRCSVAGSQSLILSLWKVNDLATAMLMTDFYGEYTKHVGPDDPGVARQPPSAMP